MISNFYIFIAAEYSLSFKAAREIPAAAHISNVQASTVSKQLYKVLIWHPMVTLTIKCAGKKKKKKIILSVRSYSKTVVATADLHYIKWSRFI